MTKIIKTKYLGTETMNDAASDLRYHHLTLAGSQGCEIVLGSHLGTADWEFLTLENEDCCYVIQLDLLTTRFPLAKAIVEWRDWRNDTLNHDSLEPLRNLLRAYSPQAVDAIAAEITEDEVPEKDTAEIQHFNPKTENRLALMNARNGIISLINSLARERDDERKALLTTRAENTALKKALAEAEALVPHWRSVARFMPHGPAESDAAAIAFGTAADELAQALAKAQEVQP